VKVAVVHLERERERELWLNCCSPIRTWWLVWNQSSWSWKDRRISSSYVIRLWHAVFLRTLWIKIEVITYFIATVLSVVITSLIVNS